MPRDHTHFNAPDSGTPWYQQGSGYHPHAGGGGKGDGKGGHHNGGDGHGGKGPRDPLPFTGVQQSAFDLMAAVLKDYGLQTLTGALKRLILEGVTDQGTLSAQLQATDEWKTRFAGNEILRQKGLGVLSPAEYLSVERSYGQVLKNFGLPEGFYDDPADYAGWIGNSVSASELQQRASAYSDIANRQDPAVAKQLQSMGMNRGDILAFIMDKDRAQPLIQRKYQKVVLGAAARRAGVASDNNYLGHLSDLGTTEADAIRGFGTVAENLQPTQTLAQIYGEDYTQNDLEREVFDADSTAAAKRKRLASQERASFSGSGGLTGGTLSRKSGGSY